MHPEIRLRPRNGPPEGPPSAAAIAFRSLADNSRSLDLVHRYETSYDRQFLRALRQLKTLRPAPPPTTPSPTSPSAPSPPPSILTRTSPPKTSRPKIEFPRTNLVPKTNTTPNPNRTPHAQTDHPRPPAFICGPKGPRPHLRLAQRPRPPQPRKPGPDQQAKSALSGLKARASGQTRIIELTYHSPDPAYAATYLNTLTNEFIEQNIDARWKMMQRTGDWLTRQLDDVKIKLERSEDALQNYARNSGLILTGSIGGSSTGESKQNVTEEKLRQIQTSLTAAQSERVSKQSRYEMAKSAAPESLPDILNDLSLRDYQTKLTDLRRQLAEMTATYKPEYSKVRRVEAQIAPLESAYARERDSILARIRNEYEEARRREKLLADDYATQSRLVTGDAEKAIQYNILKREVDTNRQIYEAMLQRVKESAIASAMRASNIRVVDPATVPLSPYKPVPTTNGALGALAGLFLGVAFVVMRERADRTFQQPGDSTYYLNLPELGVIPTANAIYRKAFYYLRRHPKGGALSAGSAGLQPGKSGLLSVGSAGLQPGISPPPEDAPLSPVGQAPGLRRPPGPPPNLVDRVELISWLRKPSMIAEAFRTVLTSLIFSGNNGSRPRVLVMTSANPAEGKTTVACNIAIALAEIKHQTLIIDADLRKPRLHEIFGLDNTRGLSDLLQTRPLPADALDGLIQETPSPACSRYQRARPPRRRRTCSTARP